MMTSNINTSLLTPDNDNNKSNSNNQYLSPAYSCDQLLVPPNSYSHYKSEPNVAFRFFYQVCLNNHCFFMHLGRRVLK